MIIVNFKNYLFGSKLLSKCRSLEKSSKKIVVAVPVTEIREISKKTRLEVYAQSLDPIETERGTGQITAKAIKSAGAKGVIVNHSENRISMSEIGKILEICEGEHLKVVVCVESLREAKKVVKLGPPIEAIALEDPKLVGSGMSITKYRGNKVQKFSDRIISLGLKPICGAGISSEKDIISAYKLGCKGVILASAVAKKDNKKLVRAIGELV